jgi:hypothetical protein
VRKRRSGRAGLELPRELSVGRGDGDVQDEFVAVGDDLEQFDVAFDQG